MRKIISGQSPSALRKAIAVVSEKPVKNIPTHNGQLGIVEQCKFQEHSRL